MGLILLIILILLLFGGLPQTGWHTYGYGPSGVVSLLLLILLILIFFSIIPWGFGPTVVVR